MRPGTVGTTVAAAAALLLGSLALVPVFAAGSWLPPVVLVVVAVAGAGLAVRAVAGRAGLQESGWTALAVPVVQILVLLTVLTWVFAPARALLGVLPTWRALADLLGVLGDGASEIREQVTPALPLTGLVALTSLFLGVLALVVDLVAVSARHPTLGGLALLGLACVPVATTTGDVSLVPFLGPATGFAVLLWADQRGRLADRARSGPGSALGTGTLPALRTGALALVVGVLLPVLVPTFAEGSFASGLGTGDGPGGSSTGTALDPAAALQGQLTQPEPIELLRLETDVADPEYLRSVSLDTYDDGGWGIGNLDGSVRTAGADELAPLPGGVASRKVTARVTALEHDDRFLPLFASVQSVTVDGAGDEDWRLDQQSTTVFGRDGARTAGRTWEMVADEARPTQEQLAASRPLPAEDRLQQTFTQLPALAPAVQTLVDGLTDDGQSPYERVQSVFAWMTDRANGWVYSLTTSPGTTGDDLADFLELRRGYCEQYAGSMAVLVRAAGVPARVVLGYTPGQVQPDGSRLITTADAHAWVEVYYAGLGWVPYDPTPIDPERRVQLPWAPRADDVAAQASAAATAPTSAPAGPSAQLDRDDQFTPLADDATGIGTGTPWGRLGAAAGGAALLLALLTGPAVARAGQRRRRVAEGSPGALWDELLATTTDLGVPVRADATPRQVARQLAEVVAGSDRPAVSAVATLALALEGSVYGPPGTGSTSDLRTASAVVDRALRRTVPRAERLRARLLPASTLRAGAAWLTEHRPRRPGPTPA